MPAPLPIGLPAGNFEHQLNKDQRRDKDRHSTPPLECLPPCQ
jgi:hypothetical protein